MPIPRSDRSGRTAGLLGAVLAAVAVIAVVGLAAPAAAVEGFQYTREVPVPAAGWVRVPLDLPAVEHSAPGGSDVHVFAPGGAEVAVRVAPAALRSERRTIGVVRVDRAADGWTLLLDVGPEPARHERLIFAMARATTAPAVRLDGSADGKSWHTLATGDLFRLGERAGLQQTALAYPSSDDRYLRLAWPREAGFPRVETVEVETVSGPSIAFATRAAECRRGAAGAQVCALALPAPGQILRRLTLEIEGKGAVGYRLYAPAEAHWRLLREGAWQRSGARTQQFLEGQRDPLAGGLLRLELHGAGGLPRLLGWRVDLAVQTVLFQAGEPGRYTLAYGGAVRRDVRDRDHAGEPPEGTGIAWIAAGPERDHPVPPLPDAGAPGAPLGRLRFDSSWTVVAPTAKPGDLVRLELPDIVYGAARPDLGDLRLELGTRQIPFFRWTPPEPAPASEERSLSPRPLHGSRESESLVTLTASRLPLTELVLTAPGGPLRRAVGVRYLEPPRQAGLPEAPREPSPVGRELWQCDPEPPLPCRAALPLPGSAAPRVLSVRLDDGDNPPLAGLDAALWRRRDLLLFVWPQVATGKRVRLVAGAERLEAPSYDFASLGEALLARPWQNAELDLTGNAAPAAGSRWARWAMPIALSAAGLFLLFLLRRVVSNP